MRSGVLHRPSGGPGGYGGYFHRCQGLWKKGDQVLYWNSVLEYRVTWVMIRPSLISSISPLPQYGFWSNMISTESYVQGEHNGIGCKKFGQELAKDVGYYWRINYSSLIRDISAFTGPPLHSSSVFLQFWTVSSGIWSLSEVEVWVFYSVDQLFLMSHFASEELSFHSSQHWSILHENQWKSTVFVYFEVM